MKINDKEISINSDTFRGMKEDFDLVLTKALGNMTTRGADEATITLKLKITLEKTGYNSRQITKPAFAHDITSVMQVKDKKTGNLSGEYELVWDYDNEQFVMRRVEDGQISMDDFSEDGDVIDVPALPAPDESYDRKAKAFDFLMRFVGEELSVRESEEGYNLCSENDCVVLYADPNGEGVLGIDPITLEAHKGHKIVVIAYGPEDSELIDNISIECEDCNEVLFELDRPENYVSSEEMASGETQISDEVVSDEDEGTEYEDPEDELNV